MNSSLTVRDSVPGSIQAVAAQRGLSVQATMVDAEVFAIVDSSASMAACDSEGGVERWQAAIQALTTLQARYPGKVVVVSFSTHAITCPSGVPDRQHGSTNMVNALQHVRRYDGMGYRFVVISDGEPNDCEETLRLAREFRSEIDAIYCGNANDRYGQDFLRQLAKVGGGTFASTDMPGKFLDAAVAILQLPPPRE